jgi:hypothetical protein
MRYNDRNFTNYQEKQRDGIDLEMWERACERKRRRERDMLHINFYLQKLTHHFEREWWSALETRDKGLVYTSYYNQENMLKDDSLNMWSNYEFFENWEEWKQHILDTIKPNKAKLRELRVKKLGI